MAAEVAPLRHHRHPASEEADASRSYRFTQENSTTSTNPAMPSGVPVWNYLGIEVVKSSGAATALGLAPATFRKRLNAGDIELEPVRKSSGSLPALWAVDELVELVAADATRAHEARQERYRKNHARQKPGKA